MFHTINLPKRYKAILSESERLGFDQRSDKKTGALLRALAAAKPGGVMLELGTGTGLSTAWILDGMDASATLVSVEYDPKLAEIAKSHLVHDPRVEFLVEKGEAVIEQLKPNSFDLIFADTWPGKYHHLEETLRLLKKGGFYMIDDMLPQPNWPEGHGEKAEALMADLLGRNDLACAPMDWSTGVMVCVKR